MTNANILMQTKVAIVAVFLVPFAVLGYLGEFGPLAAGRESQDLVHAWLQANRNGQSGREYWEQTSTPYFLDSVDHWEFTEASSHHVKVLVSSTSRADKAIETSELLVTIGNGFDSDMKLVPKIEKVRNLNDPLGPCARKAQDHIEAWLDAQRQGESGIEYWADGASVSRLYSVSNWEVVKAPDEGGTTSLNVLIESANKIGQPIRKTWRINVEQVPKKFGSDFEPKITRIVDLSM